MKLRSTTLCCATLITGLISAGCQTTSNTTAKSPVIEAGDGASPAPPTEVNYKTARYLAAIEGLSFDDGMVQVEPFAIYSVDDARRSITAGETFAFEGRHIAAIKAFGDATRHAPDYGPAYHGLAQALRVKGKMDESIAALNTALQLSPHDLDARFDLASSLWMTGDRVGATQQMNLLVANNPDHAEAHERLAIWSYYADDVEAAWAHTRAAQQLGHEMPGQFVALLEKKTNAGQ